MIYWAIEDKKGKLVKTGRRLERGLLIESGVTTLFRTKRECDSHLYLGSGEISVKVKVERVEE